MEKYGTARQATDDNTIRRMRFACWVTKATDIHIIFNTYFFSTATIVTRMRLNITLYVHCLPDTFIPLAALCLINVRHSRLPYAIHLDI
jgi:hypothetical protein